MVKKVSLTDSQVKHVADLAKLSLSPIEIKKIGKQLSQTIDYIDKLNEVSTAETEPTSNVTGLDNIFREDETKPSLSQDEALSQAKQTYNGFFKVKAVLNKDG